MALARSAARPPAAHFRSRKRSKTSATRARTTKQSETESDSSRSAETVTDSFSAEEDDARAGRGSRSRSAPGTRHNSIPLAKLTLRNARSRSGTAAARSGSTSAARKSSLPRRAGGAGPPSPGSSFDRRGTRRDKSSKPTPSLAPPRGDRELRRGKALSPLPINHPVERRTRTAKPVPVTVPAPTRRAGSRSVSARAASSSTHRRTSRDENSRGTKRKRSAKNESEMDVSEAELVEDEDGDEVEVEELPARRSSGRRLRSRDVRDETDSEEEEAEDEHVDSDEEMEEKDETDDHYIFYASLNELNRQRRSELAKLYRLILSKPPSSISKEQTKDDFINTILRYRASHPPPARSTSVTEPSSGADSPRPCTSHEGSPAGSRSPRERRIRAKVIGGSKKRGDKRRAHVPTPPPSDQESEESEDEEVEEEEFEEEDTRRPTRGRSKSLADVPRPKAGPLVARKSVPNIPARKETRARSGAAEASAEGGRRLRNGKSVAGRAFKPKSVKFSPAEDDDEAELTELPVSDEEEDEVDPSEDEAVETSLVQRRGSQASGAGSPSTARPTRAAKLKAVANIKQRSPRGKNRAASPTTSDVADVSDVDSDEAEVVEMDDDEADASSQASSSDPMEIATPLRAPRKLRNGKLVEIDLTGDDEEEEEVDEDQEMAEAAEVEDELTNATEGTLARLKKDELVRLCEEHGLEADGTKKDLATALLQWRDNDFDHDSNDSSSHSTLSAGSTETVHAETKTQALRAAVSVSAHAHARGGKAPLLMIDGHSSSPEKPRTAHQSKKNEEEEVDALDLESLQLQDKEIAPEKLTKLEKVGSGGFKDVYKGTYRKKTIAIADIRGHLTEMDIKELGLLRDLRHPNIVHFIGVSIPKAPSTVPVMIVTELCANGDLFDYLRGVQAPAFSAMLDIMLGIANGVEYLHNSKPAIIHRDIKSSNVLITAQGKAKINDFGLARVKTSTKSVIRSLVGTVNWQAPELWVPHPRYNEKVDVYSVGLVFWEMLQWHQPVKRYPFEGLNEHAIYDSAGQKRQRPSTASMGRQWGRDILELVEAMWHWDPTQRPSMTRVRVELEVQLQVERQRERDGNPTRGTRR